MANRILLVEDETNIRTMYADILREEGYEVIEEGDGKGGLENVMGGDWDLLLLDIMLPKLDGIELLKRMKDNPGTKDKPIIVLTNLEDNRIKETCFSLGVKEFIVKSNIIPSEIVMSVKKYVFNQ
jgi:DNA-binding response OmpR family regulator